MFNKTCPVCGKSFSTQYYAKVYCSDSCYENGRRSRRRELRHAMKTEYKPAVGRPRQLPEHEAKPPEMSLGEICKRALALHMTYGKYVSKFNVR